MIPNFAGDLKSLSFLEWMEAFLQQADYWVTRVGTDSEVVEIVLSWYLWFISLWRQSSIEWTIGLRIIELRVRIRKPSDEWNFKELDNAEYPSYSLQKQNYAFCLSARD